MPNAATNDLRLPFHLQVSPYLVETAQEYVFADEALSCALETEAGPHIVERLTDRLEMTGKRFVCVPCETMYDVRFKARFLLERNDLCSQIREADDCTDDLLRHLLRAMLAP